MSGSGFYKRDGDELLYGPNLVEGPTFILLRENYTEYNYPIDGWSWYDDEVSARAASGLEPVEDK
jgi:hypothetical protein